MAAIFNSPSKYIQGPDELAKLGSYVEPLGAKALVIVTPSGKKRVGTKIEGGFAEAKAELLQLSEMVLRASGRSLEALEKNDKVIAEDAVRLCREVKQYQKEIRKNHITRLNEHICNPTAGFVMMELLINMKRVSDHSKNIAQLVQGTF